MSMDNYPPGAAHDPNAPYNQEEPPEVEVLVRTVLVKETVMTCSGAHFVEEWEQEPDGSVSHTGCWEYPDLEKEYRDQARTARQALDACCKVLRQLIKDGHSFYASVYLPRLLDECEDWDDEEFTVTES